MFVFNSYLEQTGTIIYENDQQLVSGLITYNTPTNLSTGTTFAVIKRDRFTRKSDETHRSVVDCVITQFGQNEIYNLNETGIHLTVGRTRLQYDGDEYRATNVNDFGQKFNRWLSVGVVEVKFEKRRRLAE